MRKYGKKVVPRYKYKDTIKGLYHYFYGSAFWILADFRKRGASFHFSNSGGVLTVDASFKGGISYQDF